MGTLFLILAVIFLASLAPLAYVMIRDYGRFRGPRVVLCPETITPEVVEVGAARAAWTSATGDAQLRLTSCSRWPERQDCPRRCLAQIEAAPDGCLLRNRVARWYEGSTCAVCARAIGKIRPFGRAPALLGPDRRIRNWRDLTVEDLADAFATHRPVCPACTALGSFAAAHPPSPVKRPPASHTGSAA